MPKKVSVLTRRRIASAQRAKWADPVYRELMLDVMNNDKKREALQSPEFRARAAVRAKEAWADPARRAARLHGRWPDRYNPDGTPKLKLAPHNPQPETVTISRSRYERLVAIAKEWLAAIDEGLWA